MFKKLISIIIPVYNEEQNIPLICNRLTQVCNDLADKYDYEIIFVNDGSKDKSDFIIQDLAQNNEKIKYIEFSRNFGKEIALTAGINCAKGSAGIMIDADLQYPPELIPEFIKKWENGADVVIGIRKKNKNEGLTKKSGSFLFYKIMNLIGETKITPHATDYRLIDERVIKEFNKLTEKNRIARGLIDWLGFKKDYIYFQAQEREFGKPGYSFLKLFRLAMSSFVTHSLFPLKLAGYLGIFITIFAGILGVFIIINQFILNNIFHFVFSGPAMLAIFILFMIGIVLICLGLIALYIANIHNEVVNRPMYIIRKKRNINQSQ